MKKTIVVEEASVNATLAAVVRGAYEGLSWNKARELVRRGKVEVDGQTAEDPAKRVTLGQTIEVDPEGRRKRRGVLDSSLIVHLDADVVVVNKPPAILSVPYEVGDKDTLVDQTYAALKRKRPPQKAPLGVVQRLDKDTSGLMVFARNLTAKRKLSQQLRLRTMTRRYVAIVHGDARDARFETTFIRNRGDGLRGSWGVYRRPKSKAPPADAKRAITHVRVLARLAGATLVECRLETGRQHQIRIHLSEAGHPLVGERVYIRDYPDAPLDAPRIMLHAETLGFEHPRSEEQISLEQAPPEDFEQTRQRLSL